MIARWLGRAASTVGREITRDGGRGRYRVFRADAVAWERARRPKTATLAGVGELRDYVQAWLLQRWSSVPISTRLAVEFFDRPEMRVSHETIDQCL
ncbi:transposase [Actinophytocola sp.]|uniref:transposase n=1 Tax=Actinophytocola sp. TaxID=1872138 RepID=UPI003D6ACD71